MKLLDTTFLIHYWAGHENVREYLARNEESEFVTTTLNVKELAVGRELQGKLDRHELLSRFEWVEVLPFWTEHAFVAGELEARLHRDEDVNRDRINSLMGDVLIAAVAKAAGATVVTENTDDFAVLEGVPVEGY
jgi:hypothetical protein